MAATTMQHEPLPYKLEQEYQSWLTTYIRTYHPDAVCHQLLDTGTIALFSTDFHFYEIILFYDCYKLKMTSHDIFHFSCTFPMPRTYADFVTIMKILDVQ